MKRIDSKIALNLKRKWGNGHENEKHFSEIFIYLEQITTCFDMITCKNNPSQL